MVLEFLEMDFEASGITLSFDDIFGGQPEEVTLERLEVFLEKVLEDVFQKSEHRPHELVRIMDGGKVRWMTMEEAEKYMNASSGDTDESLRRNVQFALRGDIRILDQELKITFLLANNTLKRYREGHLIPQEEVQRSEPMLIRLGRQVNFQLLQLKDIDLKIQDFRRRYPLLNEFEKKMGLLLAYQREGRRDEAAFLANELAGIKLKYVRLSRGMSSDAQESGKVRLYLQKQKKSILSVHRYLTAQREGVLLSETQNLRDSIQTLKELVLRSEGERKESYQKSAEDKNGFLEEKAVELKVTQKEQVILKKKEEDAASVIDQMLNLLSLKDEDLEKSSREDTTVDALKPESADDEKKNSHRMVMVERREKR